MHIEQAKLFLTLSNEIRLRCLYLLAVNGEVCVCEIVEAPQITQPSASKALNGLKEVGLVSDRRDANWIYYSLKSDMPDWIKTIVHATITELESCKRCIVDQKQFKHLVERPREIACP